MRESSRMVAMKTRMNPDTNPDRVSGRRILWNRCRQVAPAMTAASSSSPATCIIEEMPARAEKGMFLARHTMTRRAKLP